MDTPSISKRYDANAPTFTSLIGVWGSLGLLKRVGAVDDYAICRFLVSDAQSKLAIARPERGDEQQHVSMSLSRDGSPSGHRGRPRRRIAASWGHCGTA